MKKVFLIVAFLVVGLSAMSQTGFRLTAFGGLPVGDAADTTTFTLALDACHVWMVSEGVEAGAVVGYQHSFGETRNTGGIEFDFDDVQLLPVAGTAQVQVNPWAIVGVRAGYAFGLSDNADGGFYYSPEVKVKINDHWNVLAQYRGVAEKNGSFNNIGIGFEFLVGGFGLSAPNEN
ncbi:outer membrane beta-barrel protein [Gilvibacter sp.]|uniref:outer membrane beta-barrel protein n=1 Tax=Gilvibacter sp. TaxID=2729997 RepID=UPI003F4A0FDC